MEDIYDVSQDTKVYAYIRYSTLHQAEGDSERRQLEYVKRWAKRANYDFKSIEVIQDFGLSAFHKKNIERGNLGKFIKKVDSGEIEIGSILMIEKDDRLSRADFLDTMEVVGKIVRAGIKIFELESSTIIQENSKNPMEWVFVAARWAVSHGSSLEKSNRVRQAREEERSEAREGKKKYTKNRVGWLKWNPDTESFDQIDSMVTAVQLIFDLRLKGWGKGRIARYMNEHHERPKESYISEKRSGSGWYPSYIDKILRNRAVIGEIQPHQVFGKAHGYDTVVRKPVGDVIRDHYPKIVSEGKFNKVQDLLKENRRTSGRNGSIHNIFSPLLKCGYCGHSITLLNKGVPRGGRYLRCSANSRSHDKRGATVRYDEFEELILDNCTKLDPSIALPNPTEERNEIKMLEDQLQDLEAKISSLEKEEDNIVSNLKEITNQKLRSKLEEEFSLNEIKVEELSNEKQELQKRIHQKKRGLEDFQRWKSDLSELKDQLKKEDSDNIRVQLNHHMRDLITRIEIFSQGFDKVGDGSPREKVKKTKVLKSGKELIYYKPSPECVEDIGIKASNHFHEQGFDFKQYRVSEFISWLQNKRMSKEGRFCRVHFKNGSIIDLAPKDSLATAWKLHPQKKRWILQEPNIWKLYEQFLEHEIK